MAAVRSVNAGNYIAAAKAASNNFVDTYGAVLDNSPNYRNIARKGLIENTKTHIEAMKSDARVAEAGIKKERDLRIAKYKLDSANSIWKAQESTRKAGKLAAASENLYEAFKKQREPFKPNFEEQQKYIDDLNAKNKAKIADINDPNWRPPGTVEPMNDAVPELVPWDYEKGAPMQSSNGSSTKPLSSSPSPAFVKTSTNSTSPDLRTEMYSYLTTKHKLGRNHALGIMANIHRESRFNPFSPSGDDKGPGGLFQWKGVRQTPTVAALVKAGDWRGQIDYALNEPANLSAVIPGTFQSTRFNSPQAAADWWMNKWERPLDPKAGSLVHTDFLSSYTNNNFI